jgi:ketosteroid isomerase-like protein
MSLEARAMTDIAELVRSCYRAYEVKDRSILDGLLAEDFTFTSPYDDHIDRAEYFRRCWPNAERIGEIRFQHLFVEGEDAFALYELTPRDGETFRNTEFFRFREGKLVAVEVYFGQVAGVTQKP